MRNKQLDIFLSQNRIPYDTDVDLKKRTWIHRGGMASYFISPENTEQLQSLMSFIFFNNINYLLIGCSSNLYIHNNTDIPVVVSTLMCNSYEIKEDVIECACGTLVGKMANHMINNGIKGFEYLTTLPGTVGAAIYNNSSVKAPQNSIANLLIDVDLLTTEGIKTIPVENLHFTFRSSDLKKHILRGVIIKARLRKEFGNKESLAQIARYNEEERNRILEGPAHNLGCTVNSPFYYGKMPLRYRVPYSAFSRLADLFIKDKQKKSQLKKEFLLQISGYSFLIPYVSDKLILTFIWKDEMADVYFEDYLRFMKDVYKTDQIEIEIINHPFYGQS